MPPRKRLGQLLTELGVVDEHQLQSALGHQKQWGGKLGAILVQTGFCTEEEMVSALSRHLGMPRVRLVEQKVDPRAIKFVAKPIAEKLHVFAYEVSGSGRSEVVTIAMSDPTDLSAVDQLAFHTGKRTKPMLAGDSEIVSAIAEHYGAEEKPRPSPAVAPPVVAPTAPAAPSGPFGRRADPPATRTPPGVPRMTPVMTKAWSPATAAPAAPARSAVDLPPVADDDKLSLEPIAAHSQTEAVQGQSEFSGSGSAADTMEGLEPAGRAQAAAQENWSSGGWDATQGWGAAPEGATPSQDWAAPHAEPLPDWGDQPAETAWGAPQEEPAHGEPPGHEAHPADAEESAHHAPRAGAVFDASAEEAPPNAEPEAAAFDALPEEAAGEPHTTADEPLPEEETAHELAEEALPEETAYDAQPQESASEGPAHEEPAEAAHGSHPGGEELPVDAILGTAEDAHADSSAAETHHAGDDSAEAPDAWGSTEDPLAAQEASGWSGSEASHAAADAFAEASHEAFEAAPPPAGEAADEQGFDIEESEPAAAEDVAADWGTGSAAEEAAAESGAAGDATVEMAPVEEEAPAEEHAAPTYAASGEHAAPTYAPAAGAYADEDPEARAAEAPSAPVFGMVSPDEAHQPTQEAEPAAEFEAHASAAESAEDFGDASEVPVEWSEPPHPGDAAQDVHAGSEGWTAAPEAHGEAAGPLSAQDLATLAAAVIDQHDPTAALRLLASLVRALERKGLVDLAELAAEVHESTAQEAHADEDLPPV